MSWTGRAKQGLIFLFATLTFPFVLLIYLVAALWLLPYLLVSKAYRVHLKQARVRYREEGYSSAPFSRQLGSLDVTEFLTLPFKPIFAFMDWVERRPQARSPKALSGKPAQFIASEQIKE
jgi:hypothetical protein